MSTAPLKSVRLSRLSIQESMTAEHDNFRNRVHAGVLLGLMDRAAQACANKHTDLHCMTISVDEMDFYRPVEVGSVMHIHASVNYVSNSTLIIGLRGDTQNPNGYDDLQHTVTSYFTMVARDERGRKASVPGLILEDTEDIRRFMEATIRRDARLNGRVDYEDQIAELNIYDQMDRLSRENCKIGFEY